MSRRRVHVAAVGLAVVTLAACALGYGTSQVTAAGDPCDSQQTDRGYNGCRFDRLDQANGPTPTVTVTAPGPTTTATATSTVSVPGPTTTVTRTVTVSPSASPTTPSPTQTATPTPGAAGAKARALLGVPAQTAVPWHSGFWTGAPFTPAHLKQLGDARGSQADLVTVYGDAANLASTWSMTVFGSTNLNYGLPLVPQGGNLAAAAAGQYDAQFRTVGANLVKTGHPRAVVRIGWEANYEGWPWGRKDPAQYKAAFRHASAAVRSMAPQAVISYGIGCGDGGRPQVADLYPGDDAVDVVECDLYDWYDTKGAAARTSLDKISSFARAHNKGIGLGEWGLVGVGTGNGDDVAFIRTVSDWAQSNADLMVYDCYFDEQDDYINSSMLEGRFPNAQKEYQARW